MSLNDEISDTTPLKESSIESQPKWSASGRCVTSVALAFILLVGVLLKGQLLFSQAVGPVHGHGDGHVDDMKTFDVDVEGEYFHVNTYKNKVQRRRKEMHDLTKAKEACGNMLDGSNNNWKKTKLLKYPRRIFRYDNNKMMRHHNRTNLTDATVRTCKVNHPSKEGVKVVIERVGPFVSRGDYDWTFVGYGNVFNLAEELANKTYYVVGGMFAPVNARGDIIGYPPLHIHHAHLFPYDSVRERLQKIQRPKREKKKDAHDVLIQAHGDSECKAEEGGVDCLLNVPDEGEGYRIVNSKNGFRTDLMINDVRPAGSKNLTYYVEIVLYYTLDDRKPITYMSMGNPSLTHSGPATYMVPVDPSSTLVYFKWVNAFLGGSGWWKNFVLHTHQTMFDSFYLFRGGEALKIMEKFRNGALLPMILECHDHELASTKKELFRQLAASSELLCKVDKPSLIEVCGDTGNCKHYDKRVDLVCKDKFFLKQGEEVVIVAFNQMKQNPGSTFEESRNDWFRWSNTYTNYFAAYQHTIFRADFVPAEDDRDYTAPSYYEYCSVKKDARPGNRTKYAMKNLQKSCAPEKNISFYGMHMKPGHS